MRQAQHFMNFDKTEVCESPVFDKIMGWGY